MSHHILGGGQFTENLARSSIRKGIIDHVQRTKVSPGVTLAFTGEPPEDTTGEGKDPFQMCLTYITRTMRDNSMTFQSQSTGTLKDLLWMSTSSISAANQVASLTMLLALY